MSALNATDFYKVGHKFQYPAGTNLVFSNLTARKSRIPGIDKVVFFGLQYYKIKFLQREWDATFFKLPKKEVVARYLKRITDAGVPVDVSHIEALHDLGHLPIKIISVPEGTEVPIGVPMLVMWNTHPDFFWLTNYLETSMSATLWPMITSATTALRYRRIFNKYMSLTGGDMSFVDWMGHDFSMRGMFGLEAASMSGMGHLLSFNGTDTIPAIDALEEYYGNSVPFLAGSVPATEHSVMCMGGKENELQTFRRLLGLYPSGIVSVVSDTWDYWKVLTEILPALKDEIMKRDGKLVIRPDSGDPVKILVGDPKTPTISPEWLGSYKTLSEIFGTDQNKFGYERLDPHIGLIYGDSITPERAEEICAGLVMKGFVPGMVFGIGSYTYQYVTRDTFGFAIKSTYGEVRDEPRVIFKQPATDDGTKNSAKGLLAVDWVDDPFSAFSEKKRLVCTQETTWEHVNNCVFQDKPENVHDIRKRVRDAAMSF